MELKINKDITTHIKLVDQSDNKIKVKVGKKVYELDIVQVGEGMYSIIHDSRSFNVELTNGSTSKKYLVNTGYNSYDIEIVDAQTRYIESRKKGSQVDGDKAIICPMPGKVVRIPVTKGDKVKKGQTLIVISAMKMESEYKAGIDGVVKKISVKEGDTITANQVLITLD